MPSDSSRRLAAGFACVLIVLAGCGGLPPADPTSGDRSPTGITTASPAPTVETDTDTARRTTRAPGGLLIVDVVENRSAVNASDVVQYDRTVFDDAPTLDDAVKAAVSTNSTRTRDLSSREVRQVEAVADAYDEPTGAFFVSKNGTVVRISLAYEA